MKEKNEKMTGEKERLGQIGKIVILCVACCVLMGLMLSLYQNNIPDILAEYEEEGKMGLSVKGLFWWIWRVVC